MKVALIGAGNVAWHLAQALQAAGHRVSAIYSRTAAHSQELAQRLPHAIPVSAPDFRGTSVDAVFLAVPDAALATVAAEVKVAPGTLVVHTSGSQPLDVLQTIAGAQVGVFYPLQTFSKSKPVDFEQVPLLVEAQDEATLKELELLAQGISRQVQRVDSATRKKLHLAAVFACNFTNHLFGISQQLLQEAQLPKDLLQPLIQETVSKAAQHDPFQVQTGPAARRDENVIAAHQHMLEAHPRYLELYKALTQSIRAGKE